MSELTVDLADGAEVLWKGSLCRVVDVFAGAVILKPGIGKPFPVSIRDFAREAELPTALAQPVAGIGALLDDMDDDVERAEVIERIRDLNEVIHGFKDPSNPLPDEPRAEYAPGTKMMDRYEAKADEMGLKPKQVGNLARAWQKGDILVAIDGRKHRASSRFGNVDDRWVDMARTVIAANASGPRPVQTVLIQEINVRVEKEYGEGVVKEPSPPQAKRVLERLTKNTNALKGTTKRKRSAASSPNAPYGRLEASRPGELVVLDTTPLDVFSRDELTGQWLRLELSVAMDWFSRSIVALRLAPTTNACDAAMLLFETVTVGSSSRTDTGLLPYVGTPTRVSVQQAEEVPGLPAVVPDHILVDRGRVYVSEHVKVVCERFGWGMSLARPRKGSDKGPLERFFETMREQFLAALAGYMGPDVASRGEHAEDQAYYFIFELEMMLRKWVVGTYHREQHDGLHIPGVPGLELSPDDMREFGTARTGTLRILARPNLALDFLPVVWRQIEDYGVQRKYLRYDVDREHDRDGLTGLRNATSPYGGKHADLWPFRYDPDDVSRLYIQRPDDLSWHVLYWKDRRRFPLPFGDEDLKIARALVAAEGRHVPSAGALSARRGSSRPASSSSRMSPTRLTRERRLRPTSSRTSSPASPASTPTTCSTPTTRTTRTSTSRLG